MTFDWTEYHKLANSLASSAFDDSSFSKEARLRSAISRAYYSAHHNVYKYLDARGEADTFPAGGGRHQAIIDYLRRQPNKNRNKLGNQLLRLRTDRNTADYNDHIANISSLTHSSLRMASSILSSLS